MGRLTRRDDMGDAAAMAPTPTEAKRSSALCEEQRHGPSQPPKPPSSKERPDWLLHWRSSPPRPQCSSSQHYMPKMSYTREHGNEENVAPRDAQSGKKRPSSARVSSGAGTSSLRNGLAATSLLLSKAGGLQRRREEGGPSLGPTQPVVAESAPAATATPAAKLPAAVEATPLLGAPPLVASGDATPAGGSACAAQCRCVIS
eukprot:scaffold115136_cov60-Phaeocystis_antarctica.AAC.1